MSKKQKLGLFRIITAFCMLVLFLIIPTEGYLRLAVFLIPLIISGYDVVLSSVYNIVHGEFFDEKFLMSIATIGAFFIGDYPEGVAVMVFYQLGELFQSIAVGASRRSIASLTNMRPDTANVLDGEEEKETMLEDIKIGDIIVVKPGERIGVDGIIVKGATSVDCSCITGESLPVQLGEGERIMSGCLNLSGVIRMRAESEYSQSTVARILELVENATEKKSRTENFITKFSHYYTPAVVLAAVLLAVLPPLILQQPFTKWIYRALSFLVVSCPCAVVVSVPLAFFGGVGACSANGILVKGSAYLQALACADTFVFDKTGTITKGTFKVKQIVPNGISDEKLLEICALCESYSTHPIASAIKAAYGKELDKARVSDVKELSGYGLCAVIDGNTYYVGSAKLMNKEKIDIGDEYASTCTVYVSSCGKYLGHITLGDEVKDEAREAIASLKKQGVKRTCMLSGDVASSVKEIGSFVGMDDAIGELLPEQKVSQLERLIEQSRGSCVFVGDGINDAAALARADIGIAMGTLGSDAAIECADIVIMNDDLSKPSLGIKIAKKTVRIAKQNIVFSLSVKLLILILSAFGAVGMWISVFGDVGVAVLAVLNSMRMLKK